METFLKILQILVPLTAFIFLCVAIYESASRALLTRKIKKESQEEMEKIRKQAEHLLNQPKDPKKEEEAHVLKGNATKLLTVEELYQNGCWPPHNSQFPNDWLLKQLKDAEMDVRKGFQSIFFREEQSMLFVGFKRKLNLVGDKNESNNTRQVQSTE